MTDKFIRCRGTLYNTRYIKQIKCDDDKCEMIIANTKSGFQPASTTNWVGYNGPVHFNDDVLLCERSKAPDCYEKLVKFVNEHKWQCEVEMIIYL